TMEDCSFGFSPPNSHLDPAKLFQRYARTCHARLRITVTRNLMFVSHRNSLFKWPAKAAVMANLGKFVPVLFALTRRLSRISERYDREYVQFIRYTQHGFNVIQSHESDPVRSDSLGPRRQHH